MRRIRLWLHRADTNWLWVHDTTPEDDYLSFGEAQAVPGCRCRPSNVLYWELSPAITDDCPIHREAA